MVCHVFYCPVLVLVFWLFELPVVTTVTTVVLLGAVQLCSAATTAQSKSTPKAEEPYGRGCKVQFPTYSDSCAERSLESWFCVHCFNLAA